ncbi:MAG TPA: hypothetical protein VJ508_17805 [Saprospiraceae bacterium]|nr:hypothetical protein [Saprospiraceae bacterium]
MKNILVALFIAFTAILAPSCSKKSGCPAETAQAQVDKNGDYKTGKTKSGLLPKSKHYHKKHGDFKRKKVKHKI